VLIRSIIAPVNILVLIYIILNDYFTKSMLQIL